MHTDRLSIERFTVRDCDFIVELLNEPSFRQYIGDKGVRSRHDALQYLKNGPLDQYEQRGFGLYRVSLRSTGDIVGMNGLVTRPEFDRPDLGFAFLKSHWSRGYAYESSVAIVDYARRSLGLHSIIAMADEDNGASVHLLRKLGFQLLRRVTMPGETDEVLQFELVL